MNKRIRNLSQQKQIRKYFRNNMTPAEVILWSKLNRKQLGYKFRRQYSVGPYILDFCSPELKFAIEVDGDVHAEADVEKKDQKRTEYLQVMGILIKRYTNNEVKESLAGVVEDIMKTCASLSANNTPPLTPPY